jgi:hypothetical protein
MISNDDVDDICPYLMKRIKTIWYLQTRINHKIKKLSSESEKFGISHKR